VPDKFHQPVVYMIIDVKEFVSETFFFAIEEFVLEKDFLLYILFSEMFFFET